MKKLLLSLSILACTLSISTSIQAKSSKEISEEWHDLKPKIHRVLNDSSSSYDEKKEVIEKWATLISEKYSDAANNYPLALLYFLLSLDLNNVHLSSGYYDETWKDTWKAARKFLPTIPEFKEQQEKLFKDNSQD